MKTETTTRHLGKNAAGADPSWAITWKLAPSQVLRRMEDSVWSGVRFSEQVFTNHLLELLASGRGDYRHCVYLAILASPRRMGDPRLFDTFTDHLFDLLREQGLVRALGQRDGRLVTEEALRSLTASRREKGDPRKADRVRLTVEALRRTYNAYAKPTRALSTRKPLRATGTA